MTPHAEDRVFSRAEFVLPTSVTVVDDFLTWTSVLPSTGRDEYVLGDLLADFLALERALPQEMAAFVETYGALELCEHGVPDRHEWASATYSVNAAPGSKWCRMADVDGRPAISVTALRRVARAFNAATRLSVALSSRSEGRTSDWVELQGAQRWLWEPGDLEGDWRKRRQVLAYWLTDLLRASGVNTLARWPEGARLSVVPEAEGLMGSIALALAFEIGQREGFVCSVCGAPVDRIRPPLAGEGVYCTKPACKREQQRINQRRYRERKRQEGAS